jgi:hypothetical protein
MKVKGRLGQSEGQPVSHPQSGPQSIPPTDATTEAAVRAITEFTTESPFGKMHVTAREVRMEANGEQLRAWGDASQNDKNAPTVLHCYDTVIAVSDGNGLCDLAVVAAGDVREVSGSEVSHWMFDVAKTTLPTSHPAWVPLVGQWKGGPWDH